MPTTPNFALPYPTPDDNPAGPAQFQALAERVDTIAAPLLDAPPPGVLHLWPGAAAPAGWHLCQGQTVPAGANPRLAALFGQAGGNVTLPNLQQRFPIGAGSGYNVGTIGGAADVTLTSAQMPVHHHTMRHDADVPGVFYSTAPSPRSIRRNGASVSDSETETQGGGQSHTNIPPYFVVNFIVKAG